MPNRSIRRLLRAVITMPRNPPAQRILALFESERRGIMAADFTALDVLRTEKEALLAQLEHGMPQLTAADLARISQAAQRNQGLIAAALRGLRDAHQPKPRPAFSTYSASGDRAAYPAAPPAFERKA